MSSFEDTPDRLVRHHCEYERPKTSVPSYEIVRQGLGLSQTELAHRAGVSRSWIAAVEAGKPGVEFGLTLIVLSTLGVELQAGVADRREAAALNTYLESLSGE